ncbi:MAG TPA: MiaB/RimO family radical SAM methylthiotransferase [Clostridia bacterium]|nr:MiaB/RimO family radical SAM methylthiotransferase [Clostridia bacterium]
MTTDNGDGGTDHGLGISSKKTSPKRVSFLTLGCKVNRYDTQVMAEDFERHGYELVGFEDEADVYVINTCSVTAHSEAKCRQAIHRARRKNPKAAIVVTGCYPQVKPKEVASIPGVTLAVGTGIGTSVCELLEASHGQAKSDKEESRGRRRGAVATVWLEPALEDGESRPKRLTVLRRALDGASVTGFEGRTRAFLKIQEGCERRCSYCIVPLARGPRRSKSPSVVLEELEGLLESGFKEVVLTGTDLGAYGLDLHGQEERCIPGGGACGNGDGNAGLNGDDDARLNGDGDADGDAGPYAPVADFKVAGRMDLADLLRLMGRKLSGYFEKGARLRLSSIEPYGVNPRLLEVMADADWICRHLHIPLQSGSDRVLGLMGRGYTVEEFLGLVQRIREAIPGIGITTDVIVGFPGETRREFEETVDVVRKASFSRLHVFRFSPRPKTAAFELPGQVGPDEKKKRSEILISVGKQLAKAFHEGLVGTVQQVLVEEARDRRSGSLQGFTSNYVRAFFHGDDSLKGSMVTVVVDSGDERGVMARLRGRPDRIR